MKTARASWSSTSSELPSVDSSPCAAATAGNAHATSASESPHEARAQTAVTPRALRARSSLMDPIFAHRPRPSRDLSAGLGRAPPPSSSPMGWLDLFRRRRDERPVNTTGGEDVAVFAVPAEHHDLQRALGRGGWNSRMFSSPVESVWAGLERNVPVAIVVRAGVDEGAVRAGVAARAGLRGVPVVTCGERTGEEGLHVPTSRAEDLIAALDALERA